MNYPKLKNLKENLEITMHILKESREDSHKRIINALMRTQETLYELIEIVKELDVRGEE